jgi:histidine triad (HIT) family protein
MEECTFCNTENDPDVQIYFKDELVFYAQNEKYQGALKYSGCIVPIQHRETVFDLTLDEIMATFKMLKKVKVWLSENFKPDGYNVGWNCYEVGGQRLPFHAHMHVIPRFRQEPLAGAGIRSLLKSEQNKW